MTDGVLVEQKSCPVVHSYAAIVIDAHERSSNIDVILGCLACFVRCEQAKCKVVVMSATAEKGVFQQFFCVLGHPLQFY